MEGGPRRPRHERLPWPGLLTSVPAACFALFGFAAPRLARRDGPGAVVCSGMALITAGLLLRPFAGGTPAFLAASALALAGIAVSNVLMPVIVKRYFPDRTATSPASTRWRCHWAPRWPPRCRCR